MRKVISCLILLLCLTPSAPIWATVSTGAQIEDMNSVPWQDLTTFHLIKVQAFAENQPGILHYHPVSDLINFIRIAHSSGHNVLVSAEGSRADPLGHLAIYLDFLRVVSKEMVKGDYIEIWNEPNSRSEFNGEQNDYARIYRAISNILGTSGVSIIIGAAMPTGTNSKTVTSEATWAQVIRSLPGCVGIHYEDWPFTSLPTRLAQLRAYYPGHQLCFTEVGVLAGDRPLPDNFAWARGTTVQMQADKLREIVRVFSRMSSVVVIFNVGFTTYGDDPMSGYNIFRPTCLYCGG